MTIDWFTFFAQIMNFLILVWLLKRFLYGPILKAMDDRQISIAQELHDAETTRTAAEKIREEYQQQLDQLAARKETLAAQTRQEVEVWREEHLTAAKSEVNTTREHWRAGLDREKQVLVKELQIEVARCTAESTRHLLKELADHRLQNCMTARFLHKLSENSPDVCEALAALHHDAQLFVSSSHPLPTDDQTRVTEAIRKLAPDAGSVEFREAPELICGIELRGPDCKLSWNVRESLAELETELIDAVDTLIPDTNQPVDA